MLVRPTVRVFVVVMLLLYHYDSCCGTFENLEQLLNTAQRRTDPSGGWMSQSSTFPLGRFREDHCCPCAVSPASSTRASTTDPPLLLQRVAFGQEGDVTIVEDGTAVVFRLPGQAPPQARLLSLTSMGCEITAGTSQTTSRIAG